MSFSEAECAECDRLLDWAFREDLDDTGDITSRAIIPPEATGTAVFRLRSCGIVAGLPVLERIARRRPDLSVQFLLADGPARDETALARIAGSLRSILEVERTALNFLVRLSGIATQTASFVVAVAGTKAKICDTRKTTPGWRRLEKYAVRIGGGVNHRVGLFDAVLIKDNHIAGLAREHARPVAFAVAQARRSVPSGTIVEVEVDSLVQLAEAFAAKPDIVLLDNMAVENLSIAVEMRDLEAPGVLLEASGGITLDNVRQVALTRVDRISVGALTHSAPALDIGLDFEAEGTEEGNR
jgi:nicotinate-nucleotide pyrophosphorylase (carboxylating)